MFRGYHGAFPRGLQSKLRHGAYRGHHTLGVHAKFEVVPWKRSRVMPPQSTPKTSARTGTEDYYDARATGASSRAIPFQEPHGSFLPPSPVLSFLPRPLAAQ